MSNSYPPPPENPEQRPGHGQPDDPNQGYGQPAYPNQGYGAPGQPGYGYGEPARKPSNGMGWAALVLGILALLTGLFLIGALFGLIAIILGVIARGKVKRGEATNGGAAIAGIVLGVLGILLAILAVVGAVSLFSSETFQNLTECVEQADDQAAADACAQEFGESVPGG